MPVSLRFRSAISQGPFTYFSFVLACNNLQLLLRLKAGSVVRFPLRSSSSGAISESYPFIQSMHTPSQLHSGAESQHRCHHPFGLTQTGPEMYSWYLATESHTRRVARICSGMHRVCTRSSVTRRLRWSWVPASHHRRAMTRRLSTAERARSLDCEEESAAGKDDGRSLNALARAQLQRTWGEVGLCAAGPSKVPTLPITPSTSLPRSLHPPFPCPRKWKAPPHMLSSSAAAGAAAGRAT